MAWVYKQKTGSQQSKGLLIFLCTEYIKQDSRESDPILLKNDYIKEITELSDKELLKAVINLIEKNLISTSGKVKGGTPYWVNFQNGGSK